MRLASLARGGGRRRRVYVLIIGLRIYGFMFMLTLLGLEQKTKVQTILLAITAAKPFAFFLKKKTHKKDRCLQISLLYPLQSREEVNHVMQGKAQPISGLVEI
ncbi:hypothetical protein ACJX0J_009351, partial [Zea mays]